jgi:hypothetical protein
VEFRPLSAANSGSGTTASSIESRRKASSLPAIIAILLLIAAVLAWSYLLVVRPRLVGAESGRLQTVVSQNALVTEIASTSQTAQVAFVPALVAF